MKRTLLVFLLVNLVLSACAPASAPTSTPAQPLASAPTVTATPTSTTTPTSTLTATPTATPTPIPTIQVGDLSVPDPRVTNPELFDLKNKEAPIPQFANALGNAGINLTPEEIAQGIIYVSTKKDGSPLVDKDGNPFVVAVYNLDSSLFPKEYQDLAGPIPLMIAKEGQKDNWSWRRIFLTDISRVNISASFDGSGSVELLKRNSLLRANFDFATIPYSPDMEGDLNYRLGGANDAGFSNFMTHVISFDSIESRNPRSKEDLLKIIKEHLIFASNKFNDSGRGKGKRVYILWNEIHPPVSHYPYYLYSNYGGMDLVIETYQMAREILGEDAILLYNETYNYSFQGGFYKNTKEIVDELKRRGLIDGVGMQMHMFLFRPNEVYPSEQEITEVMRSYGVPVFITEFDINQENLRVAPNNKEIEQAKIAYIITSACVKSEVCSMIGFWGVYDGDTWLKYALNYNNPKPLPFDKDGDPKLFYYVMLNALFKDLTK